MAIDKAEGEPAAEEVPADLGGRAKKGEALLKGAVVGAPRAQVQPLSAELAFARSAGTRSLMSVQFPATRKNAPSAAPL